MLFKIVVIFLTLVVLEEYSAKETYTAAVVEYHTLQASEFSPLQKTNLNAQNYVDILAGIDVPLDIIVFPECTLNDNTDNRKDTLEVSSLVPQPDEEKSLCDAGNSSYNNFLVELSCAAKKYQTYVAINLQERRACTAKTACASDGWDIYNTVVVFDRQGKVVAKYRKFHLFREYGKNSTDEPDVAIFHTDFNVTFGIFTCFDILFEQPYQSLLAAGVKHIVFPTMWFSQLPFLMASQVQQMVAEEHNVVFLAAESNDPPVASTGSGIYQGNKGALSIYVNGTTGNKVLIRNVEKNWETSERVPNVSRYSKVTDELFIKVDKLSAYTSELLSANDRSKTVCHDETFCCFFDINAASSEQFGSKAYHYRYVAFRGVRSFSGVSNAGLEVCAIITCLDDSDISSCGKRHLGDDVAYPIEFKSISVSGNFSANRADQYPNSLLGSLLPINTADRQWNKTVLNDELVERSHKLLKPYSDIITFGIYGRSYKYETRKRIIK